MKFSKNILNVEHTKKYFIIMSLLAIATIIVSLVFLSLKLEEIADLYFLSIGSNVQSSAAVIADEIKISTERFNELKNISYLEMKDTPEYLLMQSFVDSYKIPSDVSCIYLMSPLENHEVIYHVPKEKVKFYKSAEGTPLDLIYVLDVLVDKRYWPEDHFENDLNRYSIQDEVIKNIIEAREYTYDYLIDEWGHTISGYAPLYSTDGEYLGMVGVDLTTDKYLHFKNKANYTVFTLFFLCIVLFLAEMVYVLTFFNKLHADKIYTDALTNVYNRRYLNEKLAKEVKKKYKKAQKLAVALLDIDHFKSYNDEYGHDTGDECLVKFAAAVKGVISDKFGYLIRYGGEEFLACFPVESEEEIHVVLEAMQTKISEVILNESTRQITCSIGCCYCSMTEFNNTSMKELLSLSDKSLYYVKNHGRNDYNIIPLDTLS